MDLFVRAVLLAVGLLHLLPVVGVLGPAQLQRLYGVEVDTPDLTLLLRHRAVLFGIVGCLLISATVVRAWEMPALVVAFVSVGSFLVLAPPAGTTHPAVRRVIVADQVAHVALLGAALVRFAQG